MKFIHSEDGNGRLSRIMLNAELVNAETWKIIIPTVLRDNYLNGLRQASRENLFQTYCKVMDKARLHCKCWIDYAEARIKWNRLWQNIIPDEALNFNR